MLIIFKLINRFSAIPTKLPAEFLFISSHFMETGKLILNCKWKYKSQEVPKQSWTTKRLKDLITRYQDYKALELRLEYRHKQTKESIESRKQILIHIYGHLIHDKGATAVQWRKNGVFNKWCGTKWISVRENNLDHYLILYRKKQLQMACRPT